MISGTQSGTGLRVLPFALLMRRVEKALARGLQLG